LKKNCASLLAEIEKYLKKKRNKLKGRHMGYSRGQKQIIVDMLRKVKKLRKKYK
jgi:hypothetical protein